MKTQLTVALVLARSFSFAAAVVEKSTVTNGWISLFDGKTLTGWNQRGGNAKYRVEDGQIIGTSVPNAGNSFLCTEREFGNFVLELEFKVDAGLNSGVQVRFRNIRLKAL